MLCECACVRVLYECIVLYVHMCVHFCVHMLYVHVCVA